MSTVRSPSRESGSLNILIANRIGNLEVNMESGEIGGAVNADEGRSNATAINANNGNKENIDPIMRGKGGRSGEQGNGIVFGSGAGRGLQINRTASFERQESWECEECGYGPAQTK